jgi:hypothetical protein
MIEVLCNNSDRFGDLIEVNEDSAYCSCGVEYILLPCSPCVRTPLNSASFVDGSSDASRQANFILAKEADRLGYEAIKHKVGSPEREALNSEVKKINSGIKGGI